MYDDITTVMMIYGDDSADGDEDVDDYVRDDEMILLWW